MKRIYLLTLILLQLHAHAQIVTSEVKVEETNDVTTVNGKLGIGTLSPDKLLTVQGDAQGLNLKSLDYENVLISPVGSSGPHLDNGLIDIKSAGVTKIRFRADAADSYINTGGSLGIGTTAPGATLDVKRGTANGGTAQFRGTTRTTHFNYSTNEDTYIRGGKSTSNVYINDNGGNVGIGTTTPTQKLEVNGFLRVGALYNTNIQFATRTWGGSHAILFNAQTSSSYVNGGLGTTGNTKFANNVGGYGGGAAGVFFNGNGGSMYILISETSTGQGTDIDWGTPELTILRNGNVGISHADPTYKLHVNGSVKGTTLHTDTQNWSDFVFDDQYELLPLEEVAQYIETNNHLPDIPSEAEVIKNGINVGEMDAMLLRKIEELTLYTLEQQHQIRQLAIESQQQNANSQQSIKELTLYTLQQEKEIENLKLRIENSPSHKPMASSQLPTAEQLMAKQLQTLTLHVVAQQKQNAELKMRLEALENKAK